MPTGASIPPPSPTPPQPSDDPGISPEMRKALQSTQSAQAGIETERQNVNTLMGQQPKAPSYEDYKPPLWKKIAAPFIGALAGKAAPEAVGAALYGPWNRAQDAYQTQDKAWQAKVGAEERVGVPLANDTARVAQQGFENQLKTRTEAETEKRDTASEQNKQDLIEMHNDIAAGRLEKVQEKIDETGEKNKTNFEYQQGLLQIKRELADAARERADNAKSKTAADQTGWTPSEAKEINSRSRSMMTQITANAHMRSALVGSKDPEDVAQLAAIDKENADLHSQIDAVEKDVESRRTKPGSTAASPAATPANSGTAKVFNVSRWQAANPKGDANAARAEAKRQGMTVKEK
jgi:hypothetical protein